MEMFIVATHYEKINQSRQVPPIELPQNIEFPCHFVPFTKISEKKSPPTNMFCLKSCLPLVPAPPPFTKRGEETMLMLQVITEN